MSSFWQQFKETAGSLVRGSRRSVGVIAESLDRQASIQKLAARIRALNRERSDVITSIGKKVYSLHTRGKVRNRDVLSDCLRIDEMGQQVEDLQQQIEELRRQATAAEELVVELEDEAPVTEEAEEPEAPAEPPEEQITEPAAEPDSPAPEATEPDSELDW